MSNPTINVKNFLNCENIPHYFIWYYISAKTGKKTPIGEKNNEDIEKVMSKRSVNPQKPTSYTEKVEGKYIEMAFTVEESESLQKVCTVFLKYTDDIYCVDIDDPEITSMDDFIEKTGCELFKNCCWTTGNTKGIHIYVRLTNMIEYSNQQKVYQDFEGDLIKKNNMWEKFHKPMNNYNDKIPEFEYNEIKHIFNESFRKGEKTHTLKTKKKIVLNEPAIEEKPNDTDNESILSGDCEFHPTVNNSVTSSTIDTTKKDIAKLISCFSGERATNYDKWVQVMFMIVNELGKEGEDLFLEFSKKSTTYDKNNSVEFYRQNVYGDKKKTKKDKLLNIASGHFWAKEDNATEYLALFPKSTNELDTTFDDHILKANVDPFIERTLSLSIMMTPENDNKIRGFTDYDLAKTILHFYKNFVCTSVKNNIWYKFEDHRWVSDDSGSSLRNLISEDLREKYYQYLAYLTKLKMNSNNDNEKKRADKRIHILLSIIDKLGKTNDKNNISRECKELYYNPDFEKILDTNPYLMCFSNGVMDFKTGIFRDGEPSDCLSLCTNRPYISRQDFTDELIVNDEKMHSFFEQVFPYAEVRKYMFEHLSCPFIGKNFNQTFVNYFGAGSNAKSTLANEMMPLILGDYYKVITSALLTSKKPSIGGASPEVAGLKGVRYAVVNEPSNGDTINEGVMKQLTGGDPIDARKLYGDTFTFRSMFQLIVCSNTKYVINSNDKGTWRRIKLVDFASQFLDKDDKDFDENDPLHFVKDKKLNIDELLTPLLTYLVETAVRLKGVIGDCPMIERNTDEYRTEQNKIGRFIAEKIVPNRKAKTTQSIVGNECTEWFKNNYKYPIKNRELFDLLDKDYDCIDGVYHGFEMKRSSTESKLSREDKFVNAFRRCFTVTRDPSDKIPSVDICEWAKLRGLEINTAKKYNQLLSEKMGLDVKNKEMYKLVKIDKKPVQCWVGLKKNETEVELVDEIDITEETDDEDVEVEDVGYELQEI